MFKTMLDTQMIFYLMGVIGGIGILSKLVSEGTLRSLVKAAENMSKSSHRFMKLVRAKFEHACMVSDKVDNVGAVSYTHLVSLKRKRNCKGSPRSRL